MLYPKGPYHGNLLKPAKIACDSKQGDLFYCVVPHWDPVLAATNTV